MKGIKYSFFNFMLMSLCGVCFSIGKIWGLEKSSDNISHSLIEKDFKEKSYTYPLREFSVIISDDGYYPNKMLAYVGEKLRFYVTSTAKKSQCFILQNHEIFISAEKGQINEMEVVLDNPGRYKFYCPSSKHIGHLTVVAKDSGKQDVIRAVASEKTTDKTEYWTPRDYD